MQVARVICIYEWAEFNGANSSRVKRKCQLVVRLKANKCYQELLHFLSSYINLLNIKLFAQVSGLHVSATGNVTVTPPRFCLDCIAGHIALIALFWPYH